MVDTDRGVYLVDCGLATAAADNPAAYYGSLGRRVTFGPSQTLPERLAAAGVDLQDVSGVVLTHLHYDHAGALVDLPAGLPVYVHAEELATAQAMVNRRGYHPSVLEAQVNFQTYRGACEPVEGIMAMETPGHTHGHVSVIIQAGTARYLATGDAAPTVRNLEERLRPGLYMNLGAAGDSLDKLIGVWQAGAWPIPSHDPRYWQHESTDLIQFVSSY